MIHQEHREQLYLHLLLSLILCVCVCVSGWIRLSEGLVSVSDRKNSGC